MANWALTDYTIMGSKETLEKIKEVIDGLLSGTKAPLPDSDKSWEGNVLYYLGCKDYKCGRGFISHVDYDTDGNLLINADEAWSITDFASYLYGKFSDLDDYFHVELICEEPGLKYFVTNNPDKLMYRMEYALNDVDCYTEYFDTEEELADFCEKRLHMTLDEARNYKSDNEDYFIDIDRYRLIEI